LVFPDLIYDRTLKDVQEGTSKGFYNATDLNRVGQAVAWLGTELNEYGYPVSVTPKEDWQVTDFPTQANMAHYLDGITTLLEAYYVPEESPALSFDMKGLDYQNANAIEKILLDLKTLFDNMKALFLYSGDFFAGEEICL